MSRDKTDSTFSFNLSIRKQAKTVSEVPQGAVPQVTKGPESANLRLRRSGVSLLPRWGSDLLCSLTSKGLGGVLRLEWSPFKGAGKLERWTLKMPLLLRGRPKMKFFFAIVVLVSFFVLAFFGGFCGALKSLNMQRL